MDIRPQMGSAPEAQEAIQSIELLFLEASNLVCEQSEAKCTGTSPSCGQLKGAVSCIDADATLECKWACE